MDQTLRIRLRSTSPTATCSLCQQSSARIHSHYARHPADLPWGGHAVRFTLHVRKFFCFNPTCPRRIFTERLPDVVAPSARATVRLTASLHAIAFALGGEAGARLAQQIGIAASPTLLISLIRSVSVPPHPSPRILGVDDWAQRKGIRYGTALVDLERHRLIDLLPDWEAETPARWLTAHNDIAIIARDRRGAYATGVRQGAPDAVQVADRWHLLSNWHEAIERIFNRYRSTIKQVIIPKPFPAKQPAVKVLPPKSVNRRRKYAEERRARVQSERLALYTLIRAGRISDDDRARSQSQLQDGTQIRPGRRVSDDEGVPAPPAAADAIRTLPAGALGGRVPQWQATPLRDRRPRLPWLPSTRLDLRRQIAPCGACRDVGHTAPDRRRSTDAPHGGDAPAAATGAMW
ncbi:MAG: ISL3 family transposase [Chloroflexota bacterium]|nr:ISL3 family transposase [Chloroflexota bacterium]